MHCSLQVIVDTFESLIVKQFQSRRSANTSSGDWFHERTPLLISDGS